MHYSNSVTQTHKILPLSVCKHTLVPIGPIPTHVYAHALTDTNRPIYNHSSLGTNIYIHSGIHASTHTNI